MYCNQSSIGWPRFGYLGIGVTQSMTLAMLQSTPSRWQAGVALMSVTAIWGFAGPIVKDATVHCPVELFLMLRFGIAFVVLCLTSRPSWKALAQMPSGLAGGHFKWIALAVLVGLVEFAGYAAQTVGLQTTAPGKAAFIGSMSVIFVPLFMWVIRPRERHHSLWISVGLAVVGLFCLMWQNLAWQVQTGDAWVLLSAIAFALQVILVSHLPKHIHSATLVTVQIGVCTLGATVLFFCNSASTISLAALPQSTLIASVYLGIVSTVIGTIAQNWGQRRLSANHTALIFCAEPVWGLLASVVLAGETFTELGILGCGLILVAMAWSALARRKPVAMGAY